MTGGQSRLTGLLGLGLRSGGIVLGVAPVREALRRDSIICLVVAADCSARTLEKVVRLAQGRGVRIFLGPDAREFGTALGRGEVQAVGVVDTGLARGMEKLELSPWPGGGTSGKDQST